MKKIIKLFLLFILLSPILVKASNNGWVTEGKNTYYYIDGEMQKGIIEIDGNKYLLGVGSGKLYTGGFAEITFGDQIGIYYVNNEGIVQTGQQSIGKEKYYFDENGRMQKGIIEVDSNKYLYGVGTGKLYTGGFAEITFGDQIGIYYVDKNGMIQTGQQSIGKEKYYFDENGRMQKGIIEVDSNKYLYGVGTGKLYTGGLAEITFGEQSGIYYVNSDGILQIGFQKVGKDTYYFDENGRMQKGIIEVDSNKYLLGIFSGKLYTSGFADITSGNSVGTYYTNENGEIQTGLQTIQNDIYYFDENGKMQKGIVEINGSYYIFGFMSGKKFMGWATTPDGKTYYTNEEGILQKGDLNIDGNWYHFGDDFILNTGWQTINGKTYYFYADGTKATNIRKIAGVRYQFSSTGELEHSNIRIIMDISKHNGVIDWNRVWSSGEIDGVIMRIGYSLGLDSKFKTNLAEVKRLGIPYSVYHFSIAENRAEAEREANYLVKWYQDNQVNPEMGVFYDIESWKEGEWNSDGITPEMYDIIISTYKEILNRNGINMSIYTGKWYGENRLTDYGRSQIGWIAHYASRCGYKGPYRGWQYTSTGSVSGVSGNVDLSIFYY